MRLPEEEVKRQALALKAQADEARPHAFSAGEPFQSWFTRIELLIRRLGVDGEVFENELRRVRTPATWQARLSDLERQRGGKGTIQEANSWMIDAAVGVLDAIARAVDDGLLTTLEDRVASTIYTDVLDEAQELLNRGHHGCAAVIGRSALEDGLRRLARREGMSEADVEAKKASAINDWLRTVRGLYTQATNRQVQSWLDPGNAYLHNQTDWAKYTQADVARALTEIRGFLGRYGL